ncbi:TPA: protein kinase [Candidatus Woesearchaeota archaeon]|nr:protein kinase [Candidatus Woesearchaeota archaeon]
MKIRDRLKMNGFPYPEEEVTAEELFEIMKEVMGAAKEVCLREQRKLYLLGLFNEVFRPEWGTRSQTMDECLAAVKRWTGRDDYQDKGGICHIVDPTPPEEYTVFEGTNRQMKIEDVLAEEAEKGKDHQQYFASEGYRRCNEEPVDEHLKDMARKQPAILVSAMLRLGQEDRENPALIKLFNILGSTLMQKGRTGIKDAENSFAQAYTMFFSRMDRPETSVDRLLEILLEVRSGPEPVLKFKKLVDITYEGEAVTVDDALEAANIEIPGVIAMCRIAEGGTSYVYKARDRRFSVPREDDMVTGIIGKEIAVKIMKPEEELHPRVLGMMRYKKDKLEEIFYNDASYLEDLNHPAIARILGKGVANGRSYILQKYYEAGSLENFLGKVDFWDVSEQILDAVSYMHSERIVHRDIKPSNILWDKGKKRIVLADLQTCKYVWSEGPDQSFRGHTHGTSHAPFEVMRGEVIARTGDVFSLGLTLWRLYTGKDLPYDIEEVLRREESVERMHHERNLSHMLGQIDEQELRFFLAKSLCYHRKDRYQDAGEMLKAFRKIRPRNYDPKEKAREMYEDIGHDREVMEELVRLYGNERRCDGGNQND